MIDEGELQEILRVEGVEEGVADDMEEGFVFVGEDELLAEEGVGGGVLGGSLFTLGRAGAC